MNAAKRKFAEPSAQGVLDLQFVELSKILIFIDHDLRGPPWGLADRLSTVLDGGVALSTVRQMT